MASTAKVSLTVERHALGLAKTAAERTGVSLSSLVSIALERHLADVIAELERRRAAEEVMATFPSDQLPLAQEQRELLELWGRRHLHHRSRGRLAFDGPAKRAQRPARGSRPMARREMNRQRGITFDTGALIALERKRTEMDRVYATAQRHNVRNHRSNRGNRGVVASWAGRRFRRIVLASVLVEDLTKRVASLAGEFLGRVHGVKPDKGTIDAIVLTSAWLRGGRDPRRMSMISARFRPAQWSWEGRDRTS